MMGLVRGICGSLALGAVLSGTVQAQAATVSGQVSITERPGEVTEDLGNVVVFLEPASGGRPSGAPAASANARTTIALQSRQFSPRVRVVMRGATVEFPNQDPFSHNVFSKMNGGFDTGVYGRGKSRDQTFEDPGVYALYCNVHPRMTAFVITLNTPHYTQAGADGRFRIENVPPGEYRMTVWHDRATKETQTLTVPAAGVAGLRVALDARGYRYVQHKDKHGKDYKSARGDRY
jgi:plastocyanin